MEMEKETLKEHEAECGYRKVPCPQTRCEKLILFTSIGEHFNSSHKEVFKLSTSRLGVLINDKNMEKENYNWTLMYWKDANGMEFYPCLVKRNGSWYFWIKVKADPVTAAKFEVSVKSFNSQFKIKLTGPVHPVDMTVKDILETGHYLHMDRYQVAQCVVEGTQEEKKRGYTGVLGFDLKMEQKDNVKI